MKPCSKHKKSIAWLALEALDSHDSTTLRDHLAQCSGCRDYFEQLSKVAGKLSSSAPESTLEASEAFHRGVAGKLKLARSSSPPENLIVWCRDSMLTWRIALPGITVIILALALLLSPRPHPLNPQPAPPEAHTIPPSRFDSALPPTVASYQRIANQSLEDLSDLLTKQGTRPLPPAPLYTASGLDLANTSN